LLDDRANHFQSLAAIALARRNRIAGKRMEHRPAFAHDRFG
jgi:hypothetical protein